MLGLKVRGEAQGARWELSSVPQRPPRPRPPPHLVTSHSSSHGCPRPHTRTQDGQTQAPGFH